MLRSNKIWCLWSSKCNCCLMQPWIRTNLKWRRVLFLPFILGWDETSRYLFFYIASIFSMCMWFYEWWSVANYPRSIGWICFSTKCWHSDKITMTMHFYYLALMRYLEGYVVGSSFGFYQQKINQHGHLFFLLVPLVLALDKINPW
jgi:hypothetical protein